MASVAYITGKKPRLQAGENEFEVTDVSEMGLRLYNEKMISVGYRVCGTITLLCGESIEVEGMIVRENQVHLYMTIKIPIAENILEREQQHISCNID